MKDWPLSCGLLAWSMPVFFPSSNLFTCSPSILQPLTALLPVQQKRWAISELSSCKYLSQTTKLSSGYIRMAQNVLLMARSSSFYIPKISKCIFVSAPNSSQFTFPVFENSILLPWFHVSTFRLQHVPQFMRCAL